MGDYYLLDHPNPHGPHHYTTRRGRVLAIVVHITAGLEDLDATDDHSAENTARYAATTDRAVSWHSGSDSDTAFDLLPASYTAFQCRGYNSTTYGHEISKADTDWRDAPEPWRTRTLDLAGRHLGAKARALGVPIRKATKAELDRAIANGGPAVGFIGHTELDPSRRTDPGKVSGVGDTFPWAQFLAAARGVHIPTGDWFDMADKNELKAAVREVLNEGTARGQKSWASTNQAILGTLQKLYNLVRTLVGRPALTKADVVRAVDDVLKVHGAVEDSALREAMAAELAEALGAETE